MKINLSIREALVKFNTGETAVACADEWLKRHYDEVDAEEAEVVAAKFVVGSSVMIEVNESAPWRLADLPFNQAFECRLSEVT